MLRTTGFLPASAGFSRRVAPAGLRVVEVVQHILQLVKGYAVNFLLVQLATWHLSGLLGQQGWHLCQMLLALPCSRAGLFPVLLASKPRNYFHHQSL